MKNEKMKVMVEIAICAAIGFLLDVIQNIYSSAIWAWGGSFGISMIGVFLMSYRRGIKAGFLTGLIMGLLDLTDGFYAISDTWWKVFAQVGMDYIFAFAVSGFAGIMRKPYLKAEGHKKKFLFMFLGCFIGGMCKFVLHFSSGLLFFSSYYDKEVFSNDWLYSFCYNMPFVLITTVLSFVVLWFISLKQPQIIDLENHKLEKSEENE